MFGICQGPKVEGRSGPCRGEEACGSPQLKGQSMRRRGEEFRATCGDARSQRPRGQVAESPRKPNFLLPNLGDTRQSS